MKNEIMEHKKKRKSSKYYGYYFLSFVILLYVVLYLLDSKNICNALRASRNVLIGIIPILLFVIFCMGLLNYLLKPKTLSRHLGRKSGVKGWLLAIVGGILSHGAVYMWYPLLKDLHAQGMKVGLVAVFLYNRAIKIPLLPVMIYYFGVGFVIILMVYMIIASVIEGKVIELIEQRVGTKS